MIETIFLIVFVITTLICYHFAVQDHVQRAYWEGFWKGYNTATEDATIALRLKELEKEAEL